MLFREDLVGKVLSGEKTVTRRRLDHRVGRIVRYRVGGIYAVQPGRGQRHVGHIEVTSVRRERLQDITNEQAHAEGFPGVIDFITYWCGLYGHWEPEEIVAVIEFIPAPRCKRCARWRRRGRAPSTGDRGGRSR